jgi:hypothetical protein
MGAPESGMKAAEQPTAETLLTAFRTIKDDERARHVGVLDYWLSIRGDKEFPPLHDLDPLEISDAAPCSILLELIGGGQDAEIRHLGEQLEHDVTVKRIIDASTPSLLSSIARKLPIVAISRDFLAFEDNFSNAEGLTRCWVTLLPLSSCGSWVDYVYAFVSLEKASTKTAKPAPKPTDEPQPPIEESPAEEAPAEEAVAVAEEAVVEPWAVEEAPLEEAAALEEAVVEPEAVEEAPQEEAAAVEEAVAGPETVEQEPAEPEEPVAEAVEQPEAIEETSVETSAEPEPEPEPEPEIAPEPLPDGFAEAPAATGGPGFSRILEGLAQLTGFYGQGVPVADPLVDVDMPQDEPLAAEVPAEEPPATEPEVAEQLETPLELEEVVAAEPEALECAPLEPLAADEPPELQQPTSATEGALQDKLTEVRAKADEAREAALRATAALHEGLSAAYDFALDAETSPEEYLRLVEAQGLKIQLRAPMAPVARLAFDGRVDPATLGQCEKILAWALKEELPRGALLERIGQAGGIGELAGEVAKAA